MPQDEGSDLGVDGPKPETKSSFRVRVQGLFVYHCFASVISRCMKTPVQVDIPELLRSLASSYACRLGEQHVRGVSHHSSGNGGSGQLEQRAGEQRERERGSESESESERESESESESERENKKLSQCANQIETLFSVARLLPCQCRRTAHLVVVLQRVQGMCTM